MRLKLHCVQQLITTRIIVMEVAVDKLKEQLVVKRVVVVEEDIQKDLLHLENSFFGCYLFQV